MSSDEINEILQKIHKLYDEGMTVFQKANLIILDGMYRFPNDLSLRICHAAHLASTGNLTDALEIYQIALKLDPNNVEAMTGLAHVYFEKNKIDLSFQLAQQSNKIRELPETWILLFRHALYHRELKNAENILEKATALDPNHPQIIELKKRLEHIKARDDQPDFKR